MPNILDYDVFISFASSDEEIVRPIWQELCLSGLRVFWSDNALKQRLGESWFENIQSALERSRHLLLIVSHASMSSEWVQREYRAFLSHCYERGVRRLIPVVSSDYDISGLPLFLKDLEASRMDDQNCLPTIIKLFGGTSIHLVKAQLAKSEEENRQLRQRIEGVVSELSSTKRQLVLAQERVKIERPTQAAASTNNPAPVTGRTVFAVPYVYSVIRIVIGFLFACHGAQKLFGAFGGVDGHGAHISPTQILFFIGGIIEFVGGSLIAVGFYTRVAAFLCSGQMAVAYFMFHLTTGRFLPIVNQGELAVMYCFVFFYITAQGTGKWGIQKY